MLMIKERIKKITGDLLIYMYSAAVNIENYEMQEIYNSDEVSPKLWIAFNTNQQWGGYNKDFWFRAELTIPKSFEGKTVVYEVKTGREAAWDSINPQFKLYINGKLVQGLDINHREAVITENAKAGEVFCITLHAHSGMDNMLSNLKTRICILEPEVERLYYNLKVTMEAIELLHEDNRDRINILKILNNAVNILDLRRPFSETFYSTVEETNVYLEKELYNKSYWNEGVTAYCIGHTHIDVAWRWTVEQTRHKVVRSYATALRLMEDYPEYMFFSSQPQLYQFVKEDEPQLYEKIKEKVAEGRWEPEGAMWVEPDCNLVSGESLVRQLLFGIRFFRQEFGVQNKILWLPDVFGYSAAMPQLMKKSGIDYFITSKLSWNEYNKLPYDTFMWRGIDGTEVLTHFIMNRDYQSEVDGFYTAYGGMLTPSQVAGGWQRYQQKGLNSQVLHPYGYGDGGGGPTKEMLENARRLSKGIPGVPTVKHSKALDFLEDLEAEVKDNPRLPKWVGELYLEYHRGTYTSMAKNKKYNRKSEFLYGDIEWISIMNQLMDSSFRYPQQQINKCWKTILLNQFHDILPGTSIPEVYVTSHKEYEEVISTGNILLKEAIDNIASKIQLEEDSVIVFNSLSFTRSDIVVLQLPNSDASVSIYDADGQRITTQLIQNEGDNDNKILFLAEQVPAKGYKCFIIKNEKSDLDFDNTMEITKEYLSNDFFHITIDSMGNISSIYDKLEEREVLRDGSMGNVLQAFEDKPIIFDAWDINMYYQEKMWEINEVESIEVIQQGPVRGGIRIRKRFMDSIINQNIYIYKDKARIDFETTADWREQQILLKAAFPISINASRATYEIQFGSVERPTHWNTSWDAAKFEVCAHKWADLSEDNYGVSLLNDCKYGHDIKDGIMRITLIKSGIYPNPKSDQEVHSFTYSLYPHKGDWRTGKTIDEAYGLNCPLYSKLEKAHKGYLPKHFSMISVDKENVIVEAIKQAEDSGDIVIRMYEGYNRRSTVTATLCNNIEYVVECNLLEEAIDILKIHENQFSFVIKPFEIKTFKIRLKDKVR